MSSAELQALVDNLAAEVDAPAVIEDDELRMVAYSSHDVPIDDVRRQSILIRHAPPAAADWFRRYGLDSAVRPLRIPTDRNRGILGRLCVPIRHRGRRFGYLWLIDDDGRLGEAQIGSAVRTAEQAGLLMFDDLLAERLASSALARLLSPSEELRTDGARYFDSSGQLGPPGRILAVVVQAAQTPASAAQTPASAAQPLIAESLRDTTRQLPIGEVIGRANADHGVLVTRDRRRGDATELELAAAARRDLLRRLRQDDSGASLLFQQADRAVVATLETYLDLAGDIKASAERLHLHRGTLYYRLQKAEQMAGINLRSGHDRLAIHLGFKLARLAGLHPEQEIAADGRTGVLGPR